VRILNTTHQMNAMRIETTETTRMKEMIVIVPIRMRRYLISSVDKDSKLALWEYECCCMALNKGPVSILERFYLTKFRWLCSLWISVTY